MEVHNYAVVFDLNGKMRVRLFPSKLVADNVYYTLKDAGVPCYLYKLNLICHCF